MALHFITLPSVAKIQFTAEDGNQVEGEAFALETTDADPGKGRAWMVKPRRGLPGDVERVPVENVVQFRW